MTPEITITFNETPPIYQAGQEVAGQVRFETFEPLPVNRVELSVLWHTMGKGTEDSAAILFETPVQDDTVSMSTVLPFHARLPVVPLSYEGQLLKIHWVVRVRVFPTRGQGFGGEARFQVVARTGVTHDDR
jgi:hypothetical protein